MGSRAKLPIKLGLTLLLAACAVLFATRKEFYLEALVDPFFGVALASLLVLHLRVRPRWKDALLVVLCTLALAGADFGVMHYPHRIVAWLSFLGVSSLLVLGAQTVWADRDEQKLLLYTWIPALLFIISDWFASNMLGWVAATHPRTLDLYLLSFDASLRVQLSFVLGQQFATRHWLWIVGLIFYIGLAVPIAVVYAGRLVRFGTRGFSAMLAFLVTGPLGILFYSVFPAAGPHNTARQYFPFHPLSIAQTSHLLLEPIAVGGERNAMPSLHLAWTLLAWWYSRGLSWWERAIAFAFLGFTALATLGTGEHYFVDLVVAYPFALMVQALCANGLRWRDSKRIWTFVFGLDLVLMWLVGLRYANRIFWVSPVIPWALVFATFALTELRRLDLQRAVDAAEHATSQASEHAAIPVSEVLNASN